MRFVWGISSVSSWIFNLDFNNDGLAPAFIFYGVDQRDSLTPAFTLSQVSSVTPASRIFPFWIRAVASVFGSSSQISIKRGIAKRGIRVIRYSISSSGLKIVSG